MRVLSVMISSEINPGEARLPAYVVMNKLRRNPRASQPEQFLSEIGCKVNKYPYFSDKRAQEINQFISSLFQNSPLNGPEAFSDLTLQGWTDVTSAHWIQVGKRVREGITLNKFIAPRNEAEEIILKAENKIIANPLIHDEDLGRLYRPLLGALSEIQKGPTGWSIALAFCRTKYALSYTADIGELFGELLSLIKQAKNITSLERNILDIADELIAQCSDRKQKGNLLSKFVGLLARSHYPYIGKNLASMLVETGTIVLKQPVETELFLRWFELISKDPKSGEVEHAYMKLAQNVAAKLADDGRSLRYIMPELMETLSSSTSQSVAKEITKIFTKNYPITSLIQCDTINKNEKAKKSVIILLSEAFSIIIGDKDLLEAVKDTVRDAKEYLLCEAIPEEDRISEGIKVMKYVARWQELEPKLRFEISNLANSENDKNMIQVEDDEVNIAGVRLKIRGYQYIGSVRFRNFLH